MITGATRVAAVLGWPVEHSRSPQMLNAAFAASGIDAVLVPIGVAPEAMILPVKVLGNGEISVAVQVTANAFSTSAKDKIAAAGGSTTEV